MKIVQPSPIAELIPAVAANPGAAIKGFKFHVEDPRRRQQGNPAEGFVQQIQRRFAPPPVYVRRPITPVRFHAMDIDGVLVSEGDSFRAIGPQIYGLDGSHLRSWGDESLHEAKLAKSADGTIFAATKDGNVRAYTPDGKILWDVPFLRNGNGEWRRDGDTCVLDIAVVGNKVVVSGECTGNGIGTNLVFYDAATGERSQTQPIVRFAVSHGAIATQQALLGSLDDDHFVTYDAWSNIVIYDSSGREVRKGKLPGGLFGTRGVAMNPETRDVYYACHDQLLYYVTDTTEGGVIFDLESEGRARIEYITFDRSTKELIVITGKAYGDDEFHIFVLNEQQIETLKKHQATLRRQLG